MTKIEEPNGWLELLEAPKFSKDGTQCLLLRSQSQGEEAGSYKHVTLVNRTDGTERALTKGMFVVKEILGWDEENNLVYV